MNLPIHQYTSEIISSVRKSGQTIIQAPTGSGKSTIIPQMLLELISPEQKMLVLQPRRLAAKMVAHRIAELSNCRVGDAVGFATRFEHRHTSQTRILCITEGILLRMLMSDPRLSDVDMILFDEFHERSVTVDVGLALSCKLQQVDRTDLRLVIMSATLDTELLKDYLPEANTITAHGRQYPVDIVYRPFSAKMEVEKAAALVTRDLFDQHGPADTLLFMPGVSEINRTLRHLEQTLKSHSVTLLPLYANLPPHKQALALKSSEKPRVIVATNIAETSLTIPGVRYVVDSGLVRMSRFDQARGINTLHVVPIAADSATQRAGRAGRTAAGIAVRLWRESENQARPLQTPAEIKRIELSETLLMLLYLGHSVESVRWVERIEPQAQSQAERVLEIIGATDGATLTEAGKAYARLPMHPRLAKLFTWLCRYGYAEQAALCCAIINEKPFMHASAKLSALSQDGDCTNDFVVLIELLARAAQSGFDEAVCRKNRIIASYARGVLRLANQYLQYSKHIPGEQTPAMPLQKAIACGILVSWPDHVATRLDAYSLRCLVAGGKKAQLSDMSVCKKSTWFVAAEIAEIKSKQSGVKMICSHACQLEMQWIEQFFSEEIIDTQKLVFNEEKGSVERHFTRELFSVPLQLKKEIEPIGDEVATFLAQHIIAASLPLTCFTAEVNSFIDRVNWVAERHPKCGISPIEQSDIELVIHTLCQDCHKVQQVAKKPAANLVYELLEPKQLAFIQQHVPEKIAVGSRKQAPVVYEPGKPPRCRVFIQQLFGIKQTPRVVDGVEPVSIEILAPNHRPVQITSDLAGFWKNHYPSIRSMLAKKYPKHSWPEATE